jgi:hypothetical protein
MSFCGLSSGSGLGLVGLWLRVGLGLAGPSWPGLLRSRSCGKLAGTARLFESASAWVRAGLMSAKIVVVVYVDNGFVVS